ncbi:Protein suppressor of hairy wing [Gryllus bimaculatus]|nr:Protein suppressor of hairy wing [Gryllus bimaculatus]
MAPKEETNENGNATDGMTTEEKMVDVSTIQEDISSAGKHCNSIVNHSEVPVTEVFDEDLDVTSTVENHAVCRKVSKDVELDASKDEKEDYGTHIENLTNKEENSNLKTLDVNECGEVEKGDHDMMDESMCTKENSVTMSLCVSVADGAVLPPDLWHAAVKKEPVNVWIVQVSDGDFSPDSKVSSPLQIVFPWEHSWSWDSQLDPVSSDEDEPPTYTTLQTVNWDDTTSCHSGQLRDASHEGAGSSGFSDDEEMSSVTGENFNLLGSDSGLQTSSSDGDLRMLHQSGGVGIPEDSWSEDANTFALTELRLGSDADSRCSIDTDRQTEAPSSLPASGAREHFSCPLCQKTFTDQLNFKYHKRTHKDRKLFTCDLCNQKFAREKTLERHRLTHSVPVQPPVLECPACSETFEQRTQLRIHMRAVHRDERTEGVDASGTRNSGPFTCEICRKTFAHATRLKHHQAAHYERQYNCHICSVTLATKHSLRRHLYIHSGEKPFGCDICGKAFAFELYLRNHMKKHLAFKFHDCAFCPQQFCSRRELKAHLQVHRGQYHCQVCKENFRSKHKLQEHMQSHET